MSFILKPNSGFRDALTPGTMREGTHLRARPVQDERRRALGMRDVTFPGRVFRVWGLLPRAASQTAYPDFLFPSSNDDVSIHESAGT